MKHPDLHRKVMFANPISLIGVLIGWKVYIQNNFLLLIDWNVYSYTESHACLSTTSLWRELGINLSQNCLLDIEWNVQIFTEKSCLSTFHPYWNGDGVGVNSLQNFFWWELKKIQICTENSCSPTPTPHRVSGGQITISLLGIVWNIQICTEKSCLPSPLLWGKRSRGLLSKETFLLRIEWNVKTYTENSCLAISQ